MGLMRRIRQFFGGDEDKAEAKDAPLQIQRDPSQAEQAQQALSNQQQREELAARQGEAGGFSSIDRGADEIEQSGVLADFAKLDTSDLENKDEYDRTLDDDAMLVRKGFSGLSAEQIAELKDAAYQGEFGKEVEDGVKDAVEDDHYGSELHKEYGATVEYLSGGIISAEEAMAMNPTGGIAGPGAKGIAFQDDGVMRRHAIRHDAVGFLETRFGVGPGYGTKTTLFGLDSDNPLAGQLGGIFREMGEASDRVDTEGIGTSSRFGSRGGDVLAKRKQG